MATVAVAVPQLQDLQMLRDKLNKKTTYEAAVRDCLDLLQSSPEVVVSNIHFRDVLKRAMTVAKTRFGSTDVPLWKAVLTLIRSAANAASSSADQKFYTELKEYEKQCQSILGDNDTSDINNARATPSTATSSLFEGQLTTRDDTSTRQPTTSTFEDFASLLVGHRVLGAVGPSQQDERSEEMESSMAAGLSPEMVASLERELDAIAVQIMEQSAQEAPRAPPPASKAVVESLPRVKITEEKLQGLGGEDARCPVCFCLEIDDEIIELPCKHWAHPNCLRPWLSSTNTCPSCRNELPTEDDRYELEKREAEERRGAQNAVSHKEFIYI